MLSEVPTELYFDERTVFRKRILKTGIWSFELGIEGGENLPSCVIVGLIDCDELD